MTDPPNTVVQAGGQVATGVVDALRTAPVLMVVVLLNILMIAGAAYFLVSVASLLHAEKMALIDRCLSPATRSPP